MALLLCPSARAGSGSVQQRTVASDGRLWTYWRYVPRHTPDDRPMPVLVAVHGAGGTGLDQIEAWEPLAEANHIILLAPVIPNSPSAWDQLYYHPEWIHSAIEETAREYPVDGRRTYLWGYSAGGMFAFYFAFLESRYFAAVGVHGGVIENFKFQMADFAARKIPVAYYIGTRDRWWTLQQTRACRNALVTRGFPVHYVELKGADHDFYARAPTITKDAWDFLRQSALQAEPRFDALDLEKIKADLK